MNPPTITPPHYHPSPLSPTITTHHPPSPTNPPPHQPTTHHQPSNHQPRPTHQLTTISQVRCRPPVDAAEPAPPVPAALRERCVLAGEMERGATWRGDVAGLRSPSLHRRRHRIQWGGLTLARQPPPPPPHPALTTATPPHPIPRRHERRRRPPPPPPSRQRCPGQADRGPARERRPDGRPSGYHLTATITPPPTSHLKLPHPISLTSRPVNSRCNTPPHPKPYTPADYNQVRPEPTAPSHHHG